MILAHGRKVAIATPVEQTAYATYRMLTANPPLTTDRSVMAPSRATIFPAIHDLLGRESGSTNR
jgi:hypothetical protein